jgi:hypothetical protein
MVKINVRAVGGDRLQLQCTRYDAKLHAEIRRIEGCAWDSALRSWTIPRERHTLAALTRHFGAERLRLDSALVDARRSVVSDPAAADDAVARMREELRLRTRSLPPTCRVPVANEGCHPSSAAMK